MMVRKEFIMFLLIIALSSAGFFIYDLYFSKSATDRKATNDLCSKFEIGMDLNEIKSITSSLEEQPKIYESGFMVRNGICACGVKLHDGQIQEVGYATCAY